MINKLGRYEIEKEIQRETSSRFDFSLNLDIGDEINNRLDEYSKKHEELDSVTFIMKENQRAFNQSIFHGRDCTINYFWDERYKSIIIVNPDETKRQNAKDLLNKILS